jgi:amino acid permease
MKLIDAILLSLGAGFVIIAIHQIMTAGFGSAYGVIMLAFIMLFIYTFRKKR